MSGDTERATLGGGCFWCLDAVFRELAGVRQVSSGYAGGQVSDPTYRQVCSGTTGHAEVVQIEYDPAVLGFRELLEVFFATHDPTTRDRQGADVGTQYRSIILTHDEGQRRAAETLVRELEDAAVFEAPIVTEIEPLETYYPAENTHQDYYATNPEQGYCRVVISPKMAKFRQRFAARLRES